MPTPIIISFVGPSGVGKTTLIERLIPVLRSAGHRVGTVKHAPHGYNVDRTGSDSWRHRAAGADIVLLAGPSSSVVFLGPADDEGTRDAPGVRTGHHLPTQPETLDWITALVGTHFRDIDIVLAEGYAPLHDALVELQRTGITPKPTNRRQPIWLTITDAPNSDECHFDQLAEIASRIADLMDGSNQDRDGTDQAESTG